MSEPMSKVDHFWLCMDEPVNLMIICGFMEFSEPLDFQRICNTVEKRLLCFDRFKKRKKSPFQGVGIPSWETDPHFDIRSHIHRIALPYPGKRPELCEVISNLISMPLDETKPIWQAHLIENYNGSGCVLFFRIHHCIADGIALIQVLLSMTDTEPDAVFVEPKSKEKKKDSSGILKKVKGVFNTAGKIRKKITEEVFESVSNPFHLLELTKTGVRLTTEVSTVLLKLALMPNHKPNSFRGKLGIRKSVAWTEPMLLGDVKTVGKAVSATMNDVLIATVTGALRRYLQKRSDKVNELEIVVTVPVNIRKPGTELELGNKFSLVFLSLPVHIEDPVLRLREVKRRMDNLKKSADAFVGFQVLNTLGMSPAKIAKKSANLFAKKVSSVLTDVPGPRQPLYFTGKKVNNMMFWVPRTGHVGLGISIFSYDGKVSIGLVSDEKLVSDPETILEGFEEDFNYLLDLVNSGKVFEAPLVLHDRYEESKAEKNQS